MQVACLWLSQPALGWLWAAAALIPLWPLAYLLALTLSARRRPAPALPAGVPLPRFTLVVPAHDEQARIVATVQSLMAIDYPAERFEVVVIADNCSDDTASLARAAGAAVWPRTHATLRGKGYALHFAFERILAGGLSDAVVVIDADTIVSRNLLAAMAARLASGAQAVQGDYGVLNPQASWRTLLMAVALGMFHRLRSLGRQAWGVSCGLRGNGMCFTVALLRQVPHQAFGLVEDVEYGIELGRRGIAVAYADEAKIYGEMVAGARASQTQRQRWEGGRRQLVRQQLRPLMADAWRRRSLLLADLAADLATPPLASLGLAVALGLAGVAVLLLGPCALPAAQQPALGAALGGLWGLNAACLVAYVARGAWLSGTGWRGAGALIFAPVYIGWKVALRLRPSPKSDQWVRTQREGAAAPADKK